MADGETAATEYTIGWEPQPGPQTALLACPVFEVFFGGARGGGKTDGMLGEWASHADLHGKNAVGLMIRRERVQLLETIERSRQIYGPLGARYNDQDKMWRWPNGARLRFAYLERDADADAYQGHSYTRVYVTWTRETIERDRVFISNKLQDNKFLGQEYVANLQMVGSDTLVRAWLEGDWTVIEA